MPSLSLDPILKECMRKLPKLLLVPKAKGLDPHCQVSKVLPPSKAWVAEFLLNFRYGLLGKILLPDLSRICILHADQLDVISGCTSSKNVQGCSCQVFEHDPKIWKAKNMYPKIWVSVPKVFSLVSQPCSMFAIGNFENTVSSTY